MAEEKVQPQQVQVRIPDNLAPGVYANIVNMNASQTEVVFDFILSVPNQAQATLSSRVIISKQTAQEMADILEALLRQVKETKKGQ